MKIVRFAVDDRVEYGVLRSETIQGIEGKPFRHLTLSAHRYQLGEVKLLAPCAPAKIVALGLNYHRHAKEINASLPDAPLTFLKPSTAVIGPEENIVCPPASARVDYEGELGVVMKKAAWRVSVDEALDYVLGYTCFNDVTARDLQGKSGRGADGRGFDAFAAIGPCIETELDPKKVTLETYLNGELKQRGNTADLIYSIPELINFISHATSLMPGDIIATGTPSGVGPMYPGDTVEIRIKPIGTLKNYVVSDSQ
jgi:2-keto-4-pentenoate hydratase/2-oxohepta-3-ene-1,7-dioic acid hydratase in catechol pathway